MLNRLVAPVVIAVSSLLPQTALPADTTDFHEIFEERCLSCHGHSGNFVRGNLVLNDGKFEGRQGADVEAFLPNHKGNLSEDEVQLFLDVFKKQIEDGPFFNSHCETCHGRAYVFAKMNLKDQDGVLIGHYSGNDIATFLRSHGRLNLDEAQHMADILLVILAGKR